MGGIPWVSRSKGERAVRRTPGPCTRRAEGPGARCTPVRSSSPARGDSPGRDSPRDPRCPDHGCRGVRRVPLQVQNPEQVRRPAEAGYRQEMWFNRPLRVLLIHVQILRLQQFSIHLRIRPIVVHNFSYILLCNETLCSILYLHVYYIIHHKTFYN